MNTELKSFEEIKQLTEYGMEYWSARDLQKPLGYERWENFSKVIDKAMLACDVAGFEIKERIRPILMVALMGSVGLLPAALSHGMGSEIQKPLAIMIVGGILICMILSFTVLPQVFYFAYRREGKLKK